ncbi:MAG: hypothetical protein JO244_14945 [Solirubrobacterales bacterium]|nr:hypothetical protein [Solirubrobacterales bacterium]
MTATVTPVPTPPSRLTKPDGLGWRRIAPTALAALLAAVYVIVSPPSLDLAAHMLRAQLFSNEGFGLWNNWWYAGHPVVLYSVLFPAVAAALTPQLAAALASVGSATLFELLARHHFGPKAWLGALWFAAATATSLFTGRLTFAFGMLPAVATALALERRRPWLATAMAFLTALCSPVAALFAALAGAAVAVAGLDDRSSPGRLRRAWPGIAVVLAALVPVGLLALAFPEGGTEPFVFSAFWPLPLIGLGLWLITPPRERVLRAGIVLYVLGTTLSFLISSAVGSNSSRLAELLAGPLAALLLWPRRKLLLALAAVPLLYLQWHAPVRDVTNASGQAMTSAYYKPLLAFLERQGGPPFRIEIPFTKFHWEAYAVAPRFPLARGWERQLDIKYNALFYNGTLTPATYETWLHTTAIRFVAVADAPLDYSAVAERALIDRGLPYLQLVWNARHWRVYAVRQPTPIVQGAAQLSRLGPNWFVVRAGRPGTALVRLHFSPYWAITRGSGCVTAAGQFTALRLQRPGSIRVAIRFSLSRIGSRSPRCT